MPPTLESVESPHLSLQEQALATGMLNKIGNATVNFAVNGNVRYHQNPEFGSLDFQALTQEFEQDPIESLKWARESLFAITADSRLTEEQKDRRLNRYLGAYFDLTLKLDHEAFSASEPGKIEHGVPEYVPDGFVDMGGDPSIDTDLRHREMILVNKEGILNKFKDFLKDEIFTEEIARQPREVQEKIITTKIAEKIYFSMPYNKKDLDGDKVLLSEVSETVCRHHALVFQVLNQACGIDSRLLKAYTTIEGELPGRHSTNMVRVGKQWYIFDSTIPEYIEKPYGQPEWRQAVFKVDSPPTRGEKKRWEVNERFSGHGRTYATHDDMFWFVDKVPGQ
jgi:hypothetical protein